MWEEIDIDKDEMVTVDEFETFITLIIKKVAKNEDKENQKAMSVFSATH